MENESKSFRLPGAYRGCLKYSIWGTKNQIRNRFYKSVRLQLFNVRYNFVYLQLFNVKYKFVQLQLFDVKLLFSEEHIFRKQQRTVVYGRASLVSGFQLTRRNDDLLSSRHKQIFAVPHPVHEDTKIWISNKRYRTNTAWIFWRPKGPQLWGTWFRPFR